MKTELILKLQSEIDEQVTLSSQQVDRFTNNPEKRDLYTFWRGKEQAWMTARIMCNKTFKAIAVEMLKDEDLELIKVE